MTAKVVHFAPVSANIAGALRAMADAIEAGEQPNLRFVVAVFVDADDGFSVYGWGPLSNLEAIGALSQAATKGLVDG